MHRRIERYLDELREQLAGCDSATVQDALSAAEDHLATAFETERDLWPDRDPQEQMDSVIDRFGTPPEVAGHYRAVEAWSRPAAQQKKRRDGLAAWFLGYCGVLASPAAWGSFLYMILAVITGSIYFSWAVAGIYISLGLIVLIIGLPVSWLVLLSFRGIGFIEGRIVESLLGTRMPRRAITPGKTGGWWKGYKRILKTRSTWTTLIYMILMLPLGIIYFTFFITLLAVGLGLIGDPIIEYLLDEPLVEPDYYTPVWLMPVVVFAGFMLVVSTLHLSRLIGRAHGRFAKLMLVS